MAGKIDFTFKRLLCCKTDAQRNELLLDCIYSKAYSDWEINLLEMLYLNIKHVNPLFRSLGVYESANYFLIGDRPSCVFSKFKHAFGATNNSARYLHQAIAMTGIPAEFIYITNAMKCECADTNKKLFLDEMAGSKQLFNVVALGGEASRFLERLGIKHAKVYHPQFMRRFHHHEVKKYALMLKKAMENK